jgi:subtilisin
MSFEGTTRREILASVGAGVGALTVGVGNASGQETDRYNVGTASPEAEQAARERAQEVIRVLDWGGGENTVTGIFTDEAIEGLRNRQDVRYVEVDGQWQALAQTLPWGIDRVDAEVAHSKGDTGGDDSGADITIIDTGVDYNHRDLDDNYGVGYDFVNDDEDAMDDNGHGTHVAGTADAEDNGQDVIGICTAATVHAAKVLDSDGSGSYSDVAAGIEWTADQGHDVGNLSLGGSSDSQTVKDACQYAYGKGVLLVAAAGNDGPRPDSVLYPAAYEEVIAVSATNKDDDIARFSSRGPEVELAAPGVNIPSTTLGGGTGEKSGTSMASPHVAGAGGQLMDNGYSNTEARNQLNSTAEDIGLSSNEQGHGLVDTAAALGYDSSDDLNGDDGDGGGGDNAPTVDSLSLSEDNQGGSPHADFDASWSVSDDDGDLDTVDLTLTDLDDGETEDSASVDVSGSEADGTTDLKAMHEENSGHEYEVELVVTDSNGNTASDTATEVEDGS